MSKYFVFDASTGSMRDIYFTLVALDVSFERKRDKHEAWPARPASLYITGYLFNCMLSLTIHLGNPDA